MTANDTAAALAREIVRLLDLHVATDGAQGCEDVEDALSLISNQSGPMGAMAETLIAADARAWNGMTNDSDSGALWAAWDVRLIDSTPEHFSDGSGISTGLVWWSGFGSEQAIRRAVA
jgi:hypothetical protein